MIQPPTIPDTAMEEMRLELAQRVNPAACEFHNACFCRICDAPLALLERLARMRRPITEMDYQDGLKVVYRPILGTFDYWRYGSPITREEAAALLAGKGDEHGA